MSNKKEDIELAEIIAHTGKSGPEKQADTLGFINDEVNSGFMSMILTSVSNFKGIGKLLEIGGKYLFPIAFGLKAADWLFYFWKYLLSSNKNLGKTSNLFVKTITTVGVGLAVFGTAFISAALAPIIFSAVIGIDLVISLGKSIFFAVQSAKTNDPYEKEFYKSKAKENAIKTAVTGLVLGAIIVGMIFAPYVAGAIVAAVAITAAATLITMGIIGIVQRVRAHQARNALKREQVEAQENHPSIENNIQQSPSPKKQNEISPQTDIEENMPLVLPRTKPFTLSQKKYTDFFGNRLNLLQPISKHTFSEELYQLNLAVTEHKAKLTAVINADKKNFIEKYLWSEEIKRKSKLQVLNILTEFMHQFDTITQKQKITIDKQDFDYQNANDLILQIDDYITRRFPLAYQSFFKDIGGVETLFQQAYKLLVAKEKFRIANDSIIISEQDDAANLKIAV